MVTLNSSFSSSQQWFDSAQQLIPGGVNSPVRAFGSVGGTPRFIERAEGAYLYDVDSNRYLDFVASWGPAILGHARKEVVAAVQEAAVKGLSFGAATSGEVELAQLIIDRIKPVQKLRLVSTGTEATMTAIRLARGATGRDLLVKFSGHYHGHSDSLLAEAGSGLATFTLSGSAGVTAATVAQTVVLPYNDFERLEQFFAERGSEVAGVIVEAAAANMGVVPPLPGFNKRIAELCQQYSAVFILDEVLTGFRAGAEGWWGLDGKDWEPDLITFGKVIGGGMPIAALGGKAALMDNLAPLGKVYQAGTLSGNPVAVAAGLATMKLLNEELYSQLNQAADRVISILETALSQAGIPHLLQRAGTLFSLFFTSEKTESTSNSLQNYDQVKTIDTNRYASFFHSLLKNGVYVAPSAFEAWFVTAAHDEAALAEFERAVANAVAEIV